MATHFITGRTRIDLGGESRVLCFDMSAAAALEEVVGPDWNAWLVKRFLGEMVEGEKTRTVTPLTVGDTLIALYAMLAVDREDSGRTETVKSLRRSVPPAQLHDVQLALLRVVLAGFGIPGEAIEAVVNAVDAPRKNVPRGIGTRR